MGDYAATARSPRKRHALQLFAGLPARYDRMGAVMSFGQDPRWRRALVDAIDPRPGQRVLDVATGTGMVALALAERGAQVTGLDQSEQMLAVARAKLDALGAIRAKLDAPGPIRAKLDARPALAERVTLMTGVAGRVELVRGEAERLPFADGEFDALTFTYLLRYVDDRDATMAELARVVRPGGRIGMVEFGVPDARSLRTLWSAYTRAGLPLLGRLSSPAWFEVGRFLGPSIERLYAQEPDLLELWRRAGIDEVSERRMSFGAGVVMTGMRGA